MLCVAVGVVVWCCVQERGGSWWSECASDRAPRCCDRRSAAGQQDGSVELRRCSGEQSGGSDERPNEWAHVRDWGWSGLWADWTQCWCPDRTRAGRCEHDGGQRVLCVTVGVVVRCCVQERGRSRRSECASERASCCCERRAAAGQLDECLELRCCSCEQRGGSDERPIERARECDGGWSGLWAGWTQCWGPDGTRAR